MPVQVVLPQRSIPLEPGGQARCEVRVHNIGLTVDRFTFEVIGAAASWTTLEPAVLELDPNTAGHLGVRFHPPRAAHVRAGRIPFGLLAVSARDRSSSVAEQLLELSRFTDMAIELVPRRVRGRSARYELSVTNEGNSTLHVRCHARDLEHALALDCAPTGLTIFPGTTEQCRVRARSRHRLWRGPPVPRTFQVVVIPGEATPMVTEAILLHRPLLPW